MENNNNETTLDINIDDLFNDPDETTQTDKQEEKSNPQNEEMTKAVSERINTVRKKTESETENRVAKELGYESYEDLRKANEKKLLKDAGLDENDTELMSVLEKVVEKRISEDPRMKKLEEYNSVNLFNNIEI